MVIGVHIAAVFGIELQMKTENVIKGEPIILFCHIPNFTNIASFELPYGLPFRRVFCNNRDGCSINEHKIFNVNSDSSGLTLTLKVLNETIEGKYACNYKSLRVTYLLNISTLDVIDPENDLNISSKVNNRYECHTTKCLMLKDNKQIQWELKHNNGTLHWKTKADNSNCHCCNDNKGHFVSYTSAINRTGQLRCYISVSNNISIWSPPIHVVTEDTSRYMHLIGTIVIIVGMTPMVWLAILLCNRKSNHKRNKSIFEIKKKMKLIRGKFTGIIIYDAVALKKMPIEDLHSLQFISSQKNNISSVLKAVIKALSFCKTMDLRYVRLNVDAITKL